MDEPNKYEINRDMTPRMSVKIEKNSRGYNWEVGMSNVIFDDVDLVMEKLRQMELSLQQEYGEIKKSSD